MVKPKSLTILLSAVIITSIFALSILSPTPTGKENSLDISLPPVFEGIYQLGIVNASPVTVVVDCSLPEVPTEVTVHRVLKPKVDDVYAANMAQQLGFRGKLVPLNPGGTREVYTYINETHTLEIRLDGSILFAKDTNLQLPRSLPSEQDCIAIAKRWLTAHNMYSENIVKVETEPCLMVDGNPLTIGVTFKVAIGGYEAHGLGIFVAVGESGEIVTVSRSLPQSEAYSSVKLKTVDVALGILKHYLTSPSPPPAENLECITNMRAFAQLTVQKITLQYFNNAGYLQPVYVFEGEAYDQYSPNVEPFTGLVDAVNRIV